MRRIFFLRSSSSFSSETAVGKIPKKLFSVGIFSISPTFSSSSVPVSISPDSAAFDSSRCGPATQGPTVTSLWGRRTGIEHLRQHLRAGGAGLEGNMLPAQPFGRLLGRAISLRQDELRAEGKRVLVAGLGNYGLRGTRHSVGMAVLNHLASKLSVADQWKRDKRCCADVAIAKVEDVELVLMKPRRLMNVNGLCVVGAAEVYNTDAENIYLVHDDLDKPLGKVALKLGGSARGHNGVRSCISAMRSEGMPRLRIGIGRPVGEATVDHYVLGRFTNAEQDCLPQVFEQAVGILLEHIRQRDSSKETLAMCGEPVSAPP